MNSLRSRTPFLISYPPRSHYLYTLAIRCSYCGMESLALQVPPALKSISFRGLDESKKTVGFEQLTSIKVPRRLLLQFVGFSAVSLDAYPLLAAKPLEMKEPDVIRTLKLASGVRLQDIVEGEGSEACEGNLVEVNYVCRRSNGYFVHSTVDQFSGESSPVILRLDNNQIIEGLKEVILGMKIGVKRRALIPPSVGYVDENLQPIPEEFGARRSFLSHANEPLIFEVQLLKVL